MRAPAPRRLASLVAVRESLEARTAWAARLVLIPGVVIVAVVVLARTIPTRPTFALGVAVVVLALSIVLAAPSLLFALVFGATYAYWRVGPGTLNMSVCDAVTLVALVGAIPYVPWRSWALRRVLIGLVFYLALIIVPLAAHPTDRAIAEWFHRSVLFGGALLIGAAVAHRRETGIVLRTFVYASAVVSLSAVYESVTSGLEPAYPLTMHKNLAGSLVSIGILVLVVAPSQLALRRTTVRTLLVLLIAGLAATQSRGAALAVVAALAIHVIRSPRSRRRAPVFLLVVSLALIVGSVVTLEDELQTNPQFNAIDTRIDAFDYAVNDVWLQHPLAGGGLRWFQEFGPGNAGVHNIALAELSEVGLIGFFGLLVLLANTVLVLVRRRSNVGEMALIMFLFLILYGLTQIFWVAGTLTITMLMVGLAVGERPARTTAGQDAVVPATA
jgi:hypothetical protein